MLHTEGAMAFAVAPSPLLCCHFGVVCVCCRSIKRVGDKKIYLMTDVGSEYSDDQLAQISAGLKAHAVELIVV